MANRIIITGRLVKEPDVKKTQNDVAVAQFTVASDRRFKDADGKKQTDFINCVAWRQTAQFIGRYFHKGTPILIEGTLQTRTYEDKDKKKVFVSEVIVENAEFFSTAAKSEAQEQTPVPEEQTPVEPAPTVAPEVVSPGLPDFFEGTDDIDLPFEV